VIYSSPPSLPLLFLFCEQLLSALPAATVEKRAAEKRKQTAQTLRLSLEELHQKILLWNYYDFQSSTNPMVSKVSSVWTQAIDFLWEVEKSSNLVQVTG